VLAAVAGGAGVIVIGMNFGAGQQIESDLQKSLPYIAENVANAVFRGLSPDVTG
jgi:hypothetical protein